MMNFEQACEEVLRGVKKWNNAFLDNLGVTVNMRSLPSWPERCKRRRKLYGTHIISRFWCRKIRPYLNTKLHTQLVEDYETVKLKTQAELLNAVLEKGKCPKRHLK